VERVFSQPSGNLGWCGQLETAAADAVVGKVLCVCAAAAVAREVLAGDPGARPKGMEAVDLLVHWIDNPTDERFECICSLLCAEETPHLDPQGVLWWALRTATSSVGNFEGGWALEAVCSAAIDAGFSPEQVRGIVERELLARQRSD
jgi:hypothetical protein